MWTIRSGVPSSLPAIRHHNGPMGRGYFTARRDVATVCTGTIRLLDFGHLHVAGGALSHRVCLYAPHHIEHGRPILPPGISFSFTGGVREQHPHIVFD
jgi:hypothetical protein